MKIKDIIAREILDSRGNPTVEVDMILKNGACARASVPSGASTGSREALELRDKDSNRYQGKGVLKAVNNINEIIKPKLIGIEANVKVVDEILLKLDNTPNKINLGANATRAVSLACLKCEALLNNKELYEYVSDGQVSMPVPMVNIINGGAHAVNNLDIQEFMIVPHQETMKERIRAASEIFHTLKKLLTNANYAVGVGDEGGFAPNLKNNKEALDFIVKAITNSNYIPGKDIGIALDVAASEFYNEETNTYKLDGKDITSDELISYYNELLETYPIVSIEDPFYENDWESLTKFTNLVGNKIMIVGDDFFVTNKIYLQKGIDLKAGNAIIIKANQIGTITETLETVKLAKANNYHTIISHRSGETEDTFIAELAVGLDAKYIKTGSMSRGERICKYNELLRIEEKINK